MDRPVKLNTLCRKTETAMSAIRFRQDMREGKNAAKLIIRCGLHRCHCCCSDREFNMLNFRTSHPKPHGETSQTKQFSERKGWKKEELAGNSLNCGSGHLNLHGKTSGEKKTVSEKKENVKQSKIHTH